MHSAAIGFGLPVLTHLVASLIVTVAVILATWAVGRRISRGVPAAAQNFGETVVEFLAGQVELEVDRKLVPLVLPWLAALFIYVLLSSWLGLFPFCYPPTSDFSTTAGLALTAIVGIQIFNLKANGPVGAARQWLKPVWWLFILLVPLRVIDNVARTLSLSLRLFGNIAGEHLVYEQVSALVPYVLPIFLLLLGFLVGLIQAVVFTLLNLFYMVEELGLHPEK